MNSPTILDRTFNNINKTIENSSTINFIEGKQSDKQKELFNNTLKKIKSEIDTKLRNLSYSKKYKNNLHEIFAIFKSILPQNFLNPQVILLLHQALSENYLNARKYYDEQYNLVNEKIHRINSIISSRNSQGIGNTGGWRDSQEQDQFLRWQNILTDPTRSPLTALDRDWDIYKECYNILNTAISPSGKLINFANSYKRWNDIENSSTIQMAKSATIGLTKSIFGPEIPNMVSNTVNFAKNLKQNWKSFKRKNTSEKIKSLSGFTLQKLSGANSLFGQSNIASNLSNSLSQTANKTSEQREELRKNFNTVRLSLLNPEPLQERRKYIKTDIDKIEAAGGGLFNTNKPTLLKTADGKIKNGKVPPELVTTKDEKGKISSVIDTKPTTRLLKPSTNVSVIPLAKGPSDKTTINNVKAAGGIDTGVNTLSKSIVPNNESIKSISSLSNVKNEQGIVNAIKETNTLLKNISKYNELQYDLNVEQYEFNQDQVNISELSQKDKKNEKYENDTTKIEKGEDKKEEDKKGGILSSLKSSLKSSLTNLLPKTVLGQGKLLGGIGGASLGGYAGYKAGGWLSKKAEESGIVEEGGIGSKIIKGGSALAGAGLGALGGSKLGGIVSKIPVVGNMLGAANKIAANAAAKSEADQKVYVTNAAEIGQAVKDASSGGIIDSVKDLIPSKGSKIFKGGFGKSATRLAAKIGGRGFAKTTASILSKGSNLLGKGSGILSKGIGMSGSLVPMLGGLAKFAGPIGLALTAASAIHGGFKGWKNAEEIAGNKPGEKATIGQKIGATASGALSTLSLGLLDPKTIYSAGKKAKDFMFGKKDEKTDVSKGGLLNSTGSKIMMSATGPIGILTDVLINKKDSMLGQVTSKLGSLFDKQNKSEDELAKQKEESNKDFFNQMGSTTSTGSGVFGGIFNKLKDVVSTAKTSYTESRERGGSFFESLGAARKGAGAVVSGKAAENKEVLETAMQKAGITDPKEQAMFLGQMRHESGGFTKMSEGKYSANSVWKLRGEELSKKGVTLEQLKNEEKSGGSDAMYERMYGGRMGNKAPGEGAKYKGRGFIQLTGKENYTKYGKMLGIDLVNNPDLASDPRIAAKIATLYWKDRGLGEKARAGNIEGVRRGIQGGGLGLEETKKYTEEEYNRIMAKNATPAVVAKDKSEIIAKTTNMQKQLSENKTSSDIVAETKIVSPTKETSKLRQQERVINAQAQKSQSTTINNIQQGSSGGGGVKNPAPLIRTGDRESYLAMYNAFLSKG